jgi:Protein of unknown function (DUF1559)
MSEPQQPGKAKQRRWIVAAIALVALTWWLGSDMEHLLLGWIYFPLRTLPRMTVDWPSLAVGAVGLVLFVVLLHFTLSWFAAKRNFVGHQAWCWRSSLVIAGMLLLMFLAGISLVGATHQLVWIQTSRAAASQPEPVVGVVGLGRHEASRKQAEDNLKQFGIALHTHHDQFNALPPGGVMTSDGELLHGWATMLIHNLNYYPEEIDYGVPWNKSPNDRIFQCNLNEFVNPALRGPYFDEQGFGLAHVAGNVHVLPIRKLPARQLAVGDSQDKVLSQLRESGQVMRLADIKDGTSSTLLIGTVTENFKPWGHPANVRDPGRGINKSPDGFGGPPSWKGAAFVLCDGSVRQLSEKIDPRVLRQLATPAGGEKGVELERLGKE